MKLRDKKPHMDIHESYAFFYSVLEKGGKGSPSCRGDEKGVSFLDRLGFPEKYSRGRRLL